MILQVPFNLNSRKGIFDPGKFACNSVGRNAWNILSIDGDFGYSFSITGFGRILSIINYQKANH